jgi:pyruvate/2-oxoglutarate dehydrogenase complex dihydrolipoamide dehydrogenase (E3) component
LQSRYYRFAIALQSLWYRFHSAFASLIINALTAFPLFHQGNLEKSLIAKGVEIIQDRGMLTETPHQVKIEGTGEIKTARNIILAPGSIPLVPRGITVDEKTVVTSDGSLKLAYVPDLVAIIGE